MSEITFATAILQITMITSSENSLGGGGGGGGERIPYTTEVSQLIII